MSESLTLVFRARDIDGAKAQAAAWADAERNIDELRIAAVAPAEPNLDYPVGMDRKWVVWAIAEWKGDDRTIGRIDGQTDLGL